MKAFADEKYNMAQESCPQKGKTYWRNRRKCWSAAFFFPLSCFEEPSFSRP